MVKQQKDSENQFSNYRNLLSKQNEGFNMNWCFQIKEVDRRLAYYYAKQSSLVCDVGGAQGVDAFAFAEKGAFVISIDINGTALRNATKQAVKYGLDSNLNFIKASATNLPFKDNTFDLITCFSVLDHLPDKKSAYAAIGEFSRIVCETGRVAVTVPNYNFLIGTVSMKMKLLTDPEAFFEQRFAPAEVFRVLSASGLHPILFDGEFPKIAAPEILIFHFPKLFRKLPGIMLLMSLGTKIFGKLSVFHSAKYFGARMGYLSSKS